MNDAPAEQRAQALVCRGAIYGEAKRLKAALQDFTAVLAMNDAPAEQRAQALVYRKALLQQQKWPR